MRLGEQAVDVSGLADIRGYRSGHPAVVPDPIGHHLK
jgi:hypothetical protein